MRRKKFILLCSRKILISTQQLILIQEELKIILPLYLINCDFGPFYILLPMVKVKLERLLKYHYVYIKMQKQLAMYQVIWSTCQCCYFFICSNYIFSCLDHVSKKVIYNVQQNPPSDPIIFLCYEIKKINIYCYSKYRCFMFIYSVCSNSHFQG